LLDSLIQSDLRCDEDERVHTSVHLIDVWPLVCI